MRGKTGKDNWYDWPSELSCFPLHSWGSPVVAGRLGIMGSGGSSQARIFHGKPPHQTGNCFGFVFLLQLFRQGLCFVSQLHSRLWVDSLLRFHWLRICSSFKFSLQLEVWTCWTVLMAWLWQFPWKMTLLFCKLPQADQVEIATCRDLRLSQAVNIWELWLLSSAQNMCAQTTTFAQ